MTVAVPIVATVPVRVDAERAIDRANPGADRASDDTADRSERAVAGGRALARPSDETLRVGERGCNEQREGAEGERVPDHV